MLTCLIDGWLIWLDCVGFGFVDVGGVGYLVSDLLVEFGCCLLVVALVLCWICVRCWFCYLGLFCFDCLALVGVNGVLVLLLGCYVWLVGVCLVVVLLAVWCLLTRCLY